MLLVFSNEDDSIFIRHLSNWNAYSLFPCLFGVSKLHHEASRDVVLLFQFV